MTKEIFAAFFAEFGAHDFTIAQDLAETSSE